MYRVGFTPIRGCEGLERTHQETCNNIWPYAKQEALNDKDRPPRHQVRPRLTTRSLYIKGGI